MLLITPVQLETVYTSLFRETIKKTGRIAKFDRLRRLIVD